MRATSFMWGGIPMQISPGSHLPWLVASDEQGRRPRAERGSAGRGAEQSIAPDFQSARDGVAELLPTETEGADVRRSHATI